MLSTFRSLWGTGGRRADPDNESDKASNAHADDDDSKTIIKSPSGSNDADTTCAESTNSEDDLKKALTAAKEWGTYFYSVGKSVTQTAAQRIKEKGLVQPLIASENVPIISDFSRQQEEFVREKRERNERREACVAPWVGFHEEKVMREQILALSQDTRNFLRNPPAGADFYFDPDVFYPVAVATLAEDPDLVKMRFRLVPKQIKEERFWRNYFYRVALIKQSVQLTTLTRNSASEGDEPNFNLGDTSTSLSTDRSKKNSSSASSSTGTAESYDRLSDVVDSSFPSAGAGSPSLSLAVVREREASETEDFVSDNPENNSAQGLSKEERQALGVIAAASQQAAASAEEDWEAELQRELNEFELVQEEGSASLSECGDGAATHAVNDDELEREIMAQLDSEM